MIGRRELRTKMNTEVATGGAVHFHNHNQFAVFTSSVTKKAR